MSRKTEAMKKLAVAFGFGAAVTDYTAKQVVPLLKEIIVKADAAQSVNDIRSNSVVGVLDYFADNYGDDAKEPYNLAVAAASDGVPTITVKRGGKSLATQGQTKKDLLFKGDMLTINYTVGEGYDATVSVNGNVVANGGTFTVGSANVAVTSSASIKKFDLAVTADEHVTVVVADGGEAVSVGSDVIEYGTVVTITATAGEGYSVASLKVNGEDFTSGEEYTVHADVAVVAASEANAPANADS